MFIFFLIVVLVIPAIMSLPIVPTEIALKKKFDKNGDRK